MKKKLCHVRLLSLALTLTLIFNLLFSISIFPSAAGNTNNPITSDHVTESPAYFKEEKDPAQLQKELDELTYEVERLRGENVKHFYLPDGTYEAVVYDDAVHRLNSDGKWEEIDNTLSEINGSISTSNARVKFAKKITGNENLYTLHEGSYKITVGLKGALKKVEGLVTNHNAESESMTQLQKLQTIANISSNIIYKDILNGTDLEYIVVSNHIKENIIVKESAETYSYTFTLALNGLSAELVDNEILLFDSDSNEVVYRIPAPYMYDAADEYSYDVDYTLVDFQNGKYEFTVTADEEWINKDERVFPVVIDPTLVDIAQQNDTYVNSAAPSTNYGRNHDLYISNTRETYVNYTLPKLPSGANITQATIAMPYYYNVVNDKAINISAYQITSYWSETGVTWNSKPSMASTPLDTQPVYADGPSESDPAYARFYVTNAVKSWYTGTTNYGFAFKRAGGDNNSVIFIAREKQVAYGKLRISYTGSQLPQGVYAIRSSGSYAYFMATRPSSSIGWIFHDMQHPDDPPVATSDLENLFKITYRPNYNDYIIRSMLDNSLVLYPSMANNAPMVEYRTSSDSTLTSYDTWDIEYSNGDYYISHTRNGTTYYIYSNPNSNGHGSRIFLTTTKTSVGTKWKFIQYEGNLIETIKIDNFKSSLYVGDSNQYNGYVQSTRIGHNGWVSYSICNNDTNRTATDKASIDSDSGLLIANKPGQILLRLSYTGAPWIWSWTITISSLPCSGSEVSYNPSVWNTASVQLNTNCYNYALNKKNTASSGIYYRMQIGAKINAQCFNYIPINDTYVMVDYKSKDEIEEIAIADAISHGTGMIKIGKNEKCPDGMYKIALVLDLTDDPLVENRYYNVILNGVAGILEEPDYDFHWYRQNADGTWSHKPGQGPVTNLDASGEIIYDPQICNRDNDDDGTGYSYDVFVGYYAVYSLD